MIKLNGTQLNSRTDVEEVLNPTDRFTQLKKQFANLATFLPAADYLRYKRDIAQASSLENLERIGMKLVTEVCGL